MSALFFLCIKDKDYSIVYFYNIPTFVLLDPVVPAVWYTSGFVFFLSTETLDKL